MSLTVATECAFTLLEECHTIANTVVHIKCSHFSKPLIRVFAATFKSTSTISYEDGVPIVNDLSAQLHDEIDASLRWPTSFRDLKNIFL